MCLYLKEKNSKFKVAEKDIVCYKVLVEYEEFGPRGGVKRHYQTPFQETPVKLGLILQAYENHRVRPIVWHDEALRKGYKNYVSEGVIHTFATLKGAKRAIYNEAYSFGYYPVVVKCIIPKGTKYYEGVFERTYIKSYGAEKIKVGKRVTPHYTRYSEIMKR